MKISLKNLLLAFAVLCFTVFCALQPAQAEEEHKDIYYVPFKVSKQAAQEKYDKWVASQTFSKSRYREKAGKAVVTKEYVPSYYFIIDMTISYSGSRNGKYTSGKAEYTGQYSVLASQKYEDIVTKAEICSYEYDNKIKAKDLNKISDAAKEAISCFSKSGEQERLENIKSNEIETTSVNGLQEYVNTEIIEKNKFDPKTFSYECEYNKVRCYYMLSPIWVAKYKNNHKRYVCIINGQNGAITDGIDEYTYNVTSVNSVSFSLSDYISMLSFFCFCIVLVLQLIRRIFIKNQQKQAAPNPVQKQEP